MEELFEHRPHTRADIKLLVVDDREDNLYSIEAILENDGYTIKTANSGRAALRILLKEEDFTLILMDVQMPDLNGFDTATLIYDRDKLKHIPIIFITANDHGDDNVFKGYQMGGVDYIYKPINAQLLRAKVAVFAELFKKNHELRAQEQMVAAANRLLKKEIQERIQSEEKVTLLNRQLVENIAQLRTTNEELERFAYVASHDLQEPLRKIMLFSDQLSVKYSSLLTQEGVDHLERIIRSSERMQLLIRNILNFSKSATNEGTKETTALNVLLESVLSDLEVYIEQKAAVVEVGELPVMDVVPDQFRQLFQNLVINALKFSKPETAPVIRIYAETTSGMHISGIADSLYYTDFYRIQVADNGIGFDEKYAQDVFVLFKRLNSYDKYEGTGLGLSICKKIVEQHNGFIRAESSPGEGATFSIYLPVSA